MAVDERQFVPGAWDIRVILDQVFQVPDRGGEFFQRDRLTSLLVKDLAQVTSTDGKTFSIGRHLGIAFDEYRKNQDGVPVDRDGVLVFIPVAQHLSDGVPGPILVGRHPVVFVEDAEDVVLAVTQGDGLVGLLIGHRLPGAPIRPVDGLLHVPQVGGVHRMCAEGSGCHQEDEKKWAYTTKKSGH